ncbi:FemAB family XrtA/PEP-CTERM system-associated protein [Desulfatitalea alkaliphila]|uniref:FemAB family PEP-CTERM system-associated protein n=1 Tax=Desulfatitalea alkaliphila TaxID=2929485 RepID=A0AA41R714_9BACT|nr:FemAB family XrtA/PEP-CTERM system-associated protein [Desulfatitalea alkaliphila]MCJ8502106.1 FemAB family PEP-CTERM system-associated protein [Desulfatitalea alkaliphila]
MADNEITIKTAQEPDKPQWDTYILNHPNATPYHLWAWKQAIETAYGHRATYLLAQKNNNISGVLPLFQLRLAPFINQLVSLPYCDVGNCLADDSATQDMLLNQAIRLKHNTKSTTLHLRGDLTPAAAADHHFNRINTGKVRLILNLPSTSQALFNSFKSKLRSQVRKAEKNGVQFRWGHLADIDAAYHVFAKNMHELGSPVHSKTFLREVLSRFSNRAKIGLAEYNGKTIGMGIILATDNKISIPWASTLRVYNRLAPNMLLYWNFLKFSSDNGFQLFDFGRSTMGEGTYKFKQQWGAKPIPLIWYDAVNTPSNKAPHPQNGTHANREHLSAAWRKLPLTLATRIGPQVRKYINL